MPNDLYAIVGLLISLSVASERLVEIIKGFIPFLIERNPDPKKEGFRKAIVQLLGVGSGIVTALLAWPAITGIVPSQWNTFPCVLALGLLASGGSGFWNVILNYLLNVKDIKKLDYVEKAKEAQKG
jgi:hypothetical protein